MKNLVPILLAIALFAAKCPAQDLDFPAWVTPPGIVHPPGPLFVPAYALAEIQKKVKSLRIKKVSIGAEQYFFDKDGKTISQTSSGSGTKYFYDGAGKLIRTESWGTLAGKEDFRTAVFYAYDANGEPESIRLMNLKEPSQNLEENVWRFERSKDGRYIKSIHPEVGRGNLFAIYSIDEKKRLIKFSRSTDIDAPGTVWEYEASGARVIARSIGRDTSVIALEMEFDPQGKMLFSRTGSFEQVYSYNGMGLLEALVPNQINSPEAMSVWKLEYSENGLPAKLISHMSLGGNHVNQTRKFRYKYYKENE